MNEENHSHEEDQHDEGDGGYQDAGPGDAEPTPDPAPEATPEPTPEPEPAAGGADSGNAEAKSEPTYTAVNDYYESEGYWSKLVANPLNAMDRPDYFKKGWKAILTLSSIIVFCYGVYLLIAELFGEYGYISSLSGMGALDITLSIVASLFSFVLSGVVIFVMAGFLWKRANDLREMEDNALMYIVTRLFKLTGEMGAISAVAMGFYGFIAVTFVTEPYWPVAELLGSANDAMYYALKPVGLPNVMEMGSMVGGAPYIDGFGDWCKAFFMNGLLGIVFGFIIAFINLFIFYLLADIIEVVFNFLTRKNQN